MKYTKFLHLQRFFLNAWPIYISQTIHNLNRNRSEVYVCVCVCAFVWTQKFNFFTIQIFVPFVIISPRKRV